MHHVLFLLGTFLEQIKAALSLLFEFYIIYSVFINPTDKQLCQSREYGRSSTTTKYQDTERMTVSGKYV